MIPVWVISFSLCACFSFNNYLKFWEQCIEDLSCKTGFICICWSKKRWRKTATLIVLRPRLFCVFSDIHFCCRPSCDHAGGAAVKEVAFCHSWYSAFTARMLWSPFKEKIAPPSCSCSPSSTPLTFHLLYTDWLLQLKFLLSAAPHVYSSLLNCILNQFTKLQASQSHGWLFILQWARCSFLRQGG